jgi:hypothetical protein
MQISGYTKTVQQGMCHMTRWSHRCLTTAGHAQLLALLLSVQLLARLLGSLTAQQSAPLMAMPRATLLASLSSYNSVLVK